MHPKATVIPIELARTAIDVEGLKRFLEANPDLLQHTVLMAALAAVQIDPHEENGWAEVSQILAEGLQENLRHHLSGVSAIACLELADWALSDVDVNSAPQG